MPREATRGKEETEKLRRLNANLFFLKAFFVKHNMSYEYDYFLQDPTKSEIFKKLKEGSPNIAQEKVEQILKEYQALEGLEKEIIVAGLPYLGWDPRFTPKKVKHQADVIQVLPKPTYLTSDDHNTINNILEIPEILKKATGYNIWIQTDLRGKSERDVMRLMLADMYFLKAFFVEHNMSISYEDFLKNPATNHQIYNKLQNNADISFLRKGEIIRTLNKYAQLSPRQQKIINAGLPFVGSSWGLQGQAHIPLIKEVRLIFPDQDFLEKLKKQDEKRQFNLREMCANLNFLRKLFLNQNMESQFEAFLKNPLDIKNYEALEKKLRSISLGVEPLLKRLKEYQNLANISQWEQSVVIATVLFLKDKTMPTDPNLQGAVIELKLDEPSFLQLHLTMMNEHGTAAKKESAAELKKLHTTEANEAKRQPEKTRTQQAQEVQRLKKEAEEEQKELLEKRRKEVENYQAQRLKETIEKQQQYVVAIAKDADEIKMIYAALYDIHEKCQSDYNYKQAEKFWNDPKNPDNFSLMQDIITRRIPQDEAPVNIQALKYYRELVTVIDHLSSNPDVRTADERQMLTLLRPIKDAAYKCATGSLDATTMRELLALAKQAKKAAAKKAEEDMEKADIARLLKPGNITRYYHENPGNWAQRIHSYDETRKKQIDFIVNLQDSLSAESDMTPAQKAAILHSALTLLLEELKREVRATRWLGTKSRLETIIEQELEKLSKLDFVWADTSHKELFEYREKHPNLGIDNQFKKVRPKPKP